MSDWTGEALRRAALDRLGEHADPRAREALVHGSVAMVPAVAHWAGSSGPVAGHRITLAVDARTLGALRSAPAVLDALCAAFAAVVAAHPGEALLDLVLRWTPASATPAAAYRDAPPGTLESSLEDAVVDYLEARGELALARALGAFAVEVTGRDVAVRLEPHTRDALRADPRTQAALSAALRDLLADADARVRLA